MPPTKQALDQLDEAVQAYVNATQANNGEASAVVTGWALVALTADVSDGLPVTYTTHRQGQPLVTTLGLFDYGLSMSRSRVNR